MLGGALVFLLGICVGLTLVPVLAALAFFHFNEPLNERGARAGAAGANGPGGEGPHGSFDNAAEAAEGPENDAPAPAGASALHEALRQGRAFWPLAAPRAVAGTQAALQAVQNATGR